MGIRPLLFAPFITMVILGCNRGEKSGTGTAVPATQSSEVPPATAEQAAEAEKMEMQIHKLFTDLTAQIGSLSDGQKKQLAAIGADATSAIRGNPALAVRNKESLRKSLITQIRRVLTPAQQEVAGIGEFAVAARDRESKDASTRGMLSSLKNALGVFELDNDRYPTTEEGLKALVNNPANLPAWHQLVTELPIDPWGHPFIYRSPGKSGKGFDLFSAGPDGHEGGGDDIGPDRETDR